MELSQIFAGAFPENYEPPSGFYFEVNDDSPIVQVTVNIRNKLLYTKTLVLACPRSYTYSPRCLQDDINLFDYNVEERVNAFVAAAVAQVSGR